MLNRWYWSIPISFIISLMLILQPCNPLKGTGQVAGVDVNLRNENFADVSEVIPSIQLDIRYYTPYNFVGEPIDGYNAPICLLTRQAAEALAKVQAEFRQTSYT
jgi:D-alanyl-D-alanine dipeptidase